jgi:precorrin-6B methylase 2
MLRDRRELEYVDYGRGAAKSGGVEESRRRVCDIAAGSLTSRRYAQMLSRLVHWLGGQLREGDRGLTIVELGTSLGLTTAYLAKPDSRNMVLTYEGCEAVAAVARENWKSMCVSNIRCIEGRIDVEKLDKELSVVDVAFVDANHTYAGAREYFNVLARKVHAKSVIVMDDIHHNEEMERVWKEICEDDRVTSTMDLYQMGLVFFDPHYWRRNYRMRLK